MGVNLTVSAQHTHTHGRTDTTHYEPKHGIHCRALVVVDNLPAANMSQHQMPTSIHYLHHKERKTKASASSLPIDSCSAASSAPHSLPALQPVHCGGVDGHRLLRGHVGPVLEVVVLTLLWGEGGQGCTREMLRGVMEGHIMQRDDMDTKQNTWHYKAKQWWSTAGV